MNSVVRLNTNIDEVNIRACSNPQKPIKLCSFYTKLPTCLKLRINDKK